MSERAHASLAPWSSFGALCVRVYRVRHDFCQTAHVYWLWRTVVRPQFLICACTALCGPANPRAAPCRVSPNCSANVPTASASGQAWSPLACFSKIVATPLAPRGPRWQQKPRLLLLQDESFGTSSPRAVELVTCRVLETRSSASARLGGHAHRTLVGTYLPQPRHPAKLQAFTSRLRHVMLASAACPSVRCFALAAVFCRSHCAQARRFVASARSFCRPCRVQEPHWLNHSKKNVQIAL